MKKGSNIPNIDNSSLMEKISLVSPYLESTGPNRTRRARIAVGKRKPFGILGNSPFILFNSEIYREFPFFDESESESSAEKQNSNRPDIFIRLQQQMAFFFKWSNEKGVFKGGHESESVRTSIINLSSSHLRTYQHSPGFLFDVANNPEIPSRNLRPSNKLNQLIYQRVGKNLFSSRAHKSFILTGSIAQQSSDLTVEGLSPDLTSKKTSGDQAIKTINQTVRSDWGQQVELLSRNFSLGTLDIASENHVFTNSKNRITGSSLEEGRSAENLSPELDAAVNLTRQILSDSQNRNSSGLFPEKAVATETQGLQDKRFPLSFSEIEDNQTVSESEGVTQVRQDKTPDWLISGQKMGRLISILSKPFLYRSRSWPGTKDLQPGTSHQSTVPVSILQLFNNKSLFFNDTNKQALFPDDKTLADLRSTRHRESPGNKDPVQHLYPDKKRMLSLRTGRHNHKIPAVFFEETSLTGQPNLLDSSQKDRAKDSAGLLEKSQLKKISRLFPALEPVKRAKTRGAALIEPPSHQNVLAQRTHMKMREILEIQESKKHSNQTNEFQSTALLQKLCDQLLSDQQLSRADTKTLIQAIQGLGKQLERTAGSEPGIPSRPFKPLHFFGPV